MQVIDVDPWTAPPEDQDRVTVKQRPDGRFEFSGMVGGDRIAMTLDPDVYDSADHARNNGLAWAEQNGSKVVYVVMPSA